jgi:outer membrane protein insertion porin family
MQRELLNPDALNEPKRIALNVNVREIRPFELSYGGYFNTDRGPGGVLRLENRNSLGAARVIGMQGRYDADFREARTYFSQPLLETLPLKTTVSGFWRRELFDAFIDDSIGVSAQQETRFAKKFVFNYGYRLQRTHTFERDPDPLFPLNVTLRVAPLTASLTRESRDELLDASRGSFTSHAFEWAPEALGSQLRFVRYFGQYFKYIPLREPEELPWSGVFKSRWVYAGGVRMGFAAGLGGQVLVPSQRFYAGGGTSVRGFEHNGLGPKDFGGEALGGNAVLIVNNEFRFPLYWIFDGVGFIDFGNVYPKVSDFSLTDIRRTGGFGLRARTPWFLLRLDYGVKFDMRPGESRSKLFFSIGQAF